MQYRVAFVGPVEWLMSNRVGAVRRDRRVVTSGVLSHEGLNVSSLAWDTEIILVHIGDDLDRGLGVIKSARGRRPSARAIAVTRTDDEDLFFRLIAHGAWGWIGSAGDPSAHVASIARVGAGMLDYPPDVLHRIETKRGRMRLLPRATG